MKLLVVAVLFISFIGSLRAQEEIDSCYCDVASADRVGCTAGSNLTENECLSNHCCYSNDDVTTPSCYERKARCGEDQCTIQPEKRAPCGSWQLGKAFCDKLNCCYDHRMFPYCYYSKDGARHNASEVITVTTAENETITEQDGDVIIDIDIDLMGPNTTHFNPETSHLVKVECSSQHEGRVPCGSAFVSRDRCLDMSCCWGPTADGPPCFHPITKPLDGDDGYMNELGQMFAEYITIGEDDVQEPQLDEFEHEEIDYGKFSVVIECLNMDVAGISQDLCPANNRKRCLDTSCCWNGTDCLRPVSRFSNNTDEIDIPNVQGPQGSTKDPEFWNPLFVNVNVHESVENRSLTCDHTMAALSCGYAGINRTACMEKGCCWMPQFATRGRYDMLCSLPVLTDDTPLEITEPQDEEEVGSDWGPWEGWSACYATEPCSKRAERMRWRTCERNVFGSGCSLQEEQLQIVPCFKPTECLDTHWSEWSRWSECSLSCGGFGFQERQRECIKGDTLESNPLCEDAHAAFDHLIADKEMKDCVRGVCPR